MNWPEGTGRVVLDAVDSTNAEAARRAPPDRPVWILARRQTAARGRRGRVWVDLDGNFAATHLFRPDCGPEVAALYSFVACLALGETFDALAPGTEVSFKWPNDALLEGRKAAGILLESAGSRGRLDWLAVGIGINLAQAPREAELRPGGTPAVALADITGKAVLPETALDILAPAFARWDERFRSQGFAPIRAAWLARAARLGGPVEAQLAGERLTGTFEDVDSDGALVLGTAHGSRRISAADIFFPD